jgi:beta-galactosidase
MFRAGIQNKLRDFVRNGGILISTCFSGLVNDTDLCFLGEATEEKLSDVFGMWVEETDSLYDNERNFMKWNGKEYPLYELCEVIHPTDCQVLSVYEKDYYKGTPTLTCNNFGKGKAYHIASTSDLEFYNDFMKMIAEDAGLECAFSGELPEGVNSAFRVSDGRKIIFLQNYNEEAVEISTDKAYKDVLTGEQYQNKIGINGFSCKIVTEV